MEETTTIKLSKDTVKALKKLGKMGDTYENVILRLINRVTRKGSM